jgi:hypothetical protein
MTLQFAPIEIKHSTCLVLFVKIEFESTCERVLNYKRNAMCSPSPRQILFSKKKVVIISLIWFLENNIHLRLGNHQKNTKRACAFLLCSLGPRCKLFFEKKKKKKAFISLT